MLEFADWNDLEEQCLLLASHLAGLTVIDYPLQLVILLSHNHNFLAEEALTEEQINNFVPLLALIQLLIGRCLAFNIVSNNEIFKHLFPEYTSSSPDLLCIGLGVYVELGETGATPIILNEFIRELDFIEKTKINNIQSEIQVPIISKEGPIKEGVYGGIRGEYYCIYGKKGSSLYVSPLPSTIKACLNTPLSSKSQQAMSGSPTKAEIKNYNKSLLKKLLLPTMRHANGCTSSSFSNRHEFKLVWKQLYCGCAFALRKDFCRIKISQDVFIQVINNNLKAFSIVQ